MPRSGSTTPAYPTLQCYSCNQQFAQRQLQAPSRNEDGDVCCPNCESDFVELIDQAPGLPSEGNGGAAQQTAAQNGRQQDGATANNARGVAGEPRGGGSSLGGARIEFTAMFHPTPDVGGDMPLTFVDAISRFAPLSLPNGQQAFVLQVQDGALLSPFTMGIPFGDALALNPGDWVVGDDLDAVVTRVLDAYMPPRRATAPEVRDALPRLRVRPGPLSPRPTAALEAAAAAAATASLSLRSPSSATAAGATAFASEPAGGGGAETGGSGGGEGMPGPWSGAAAAAPPSRRAVVAESSDTGAATAGSDSWEASSGGGGDATAAAACDAAAAAGQGVAVRLEPLGTCDNAPGQALDGDGGLKVRLRYLEGVRVPDAGSAAAACAGPPTSATAPPQIDGSVAGEAAAAACRPVPARPCPPSASVSGAEAASDPAAASAGGAAGYASCQPGELCTVCHDAFEAGSEVVELPCHHCFHEDCILPWLQQQNSCPVCRTRLREATGSSSSHQQLQHQDQQQQQQQQQALGPQADTPPANLRAPGERAAQDHTGIGDAGDTAAAVAAAARLQMGPAPPSRQSQRPRAGTGRSAPFPLLGALGQQPVAPPVLSPEELQEAEEVLGALRTRFEPLQLSAGPGAGGAASLPGAAGLMPLFGPGPTRGSHAQPQSRSTGGSDQRQQQGHGQGATMALRGGFFNNPLLNLYGSSTGRGAAAPASGGASAPSGTRSALRGGFFNSSGGGGIAAGATVAGGGGGGAAASPHQARTDGSGASGLGAADALPRRQPRQPPQAFGSGAAPGDGVPPALRPEVLPRMIWSVAIANAAQAAGLLGVNPYALPAELAAGRWPLAGARGRGGSGTATGAAAAPAPSAAAGAAASQQGAAAPAPSAAGARAGARPRSGDGLPLVIGNDMARALSDPDLGAEAVLLQLTRLLPRLERAGRPRPSEAQLRELQRVAMMAAAQMVHTMPIGPTDPALMPRIAAEGHRWLARATEIVRRPPLPTARAAGTDGGPAPQANSSSSSAAAGGAGAGNVAAAGIAGQRGRPSSGSGEGANGEGATSADEGPTRQVARHSASQDAATLAHMQQQQQSAGASDEGGLRAAAVAEGPATAGTAEAVRVGGAAAGVADGRTGAVAGSGAASTEGAGGRGARVRPVVRGRVVAAVRGGQATPGHGAAVAVAAGPPRRSASLVRAALNDSGDGRGGGAAAAPTPAAAGNRRTAGGGGGRGGARGGGGGFNPLAAVVGGAGAGLRFIGGVAGGLFWRGRSNANGDRGSNGQSGGSGTTPADGAARG